MFHPSLSNMQRPDYQTLLCPCTSFPLMHDAIQVPHRRAPPPLLPRLPPLLTAYSCSAGVTTRSSSTPHTVLTRLEASFAAPCSIRQTHSTQHRQHHFDRVPMHQCALCPHGNGRRRRFAVPGPATSWLAHLRRRVSAGPARQRVSQQRAEGRGQLLLAGHHPHGGAHTGAARQGRGGQQVLARVAAAGKGRGRRRQSARGAN